ncbi:g coupled receptor like [Trichoderma arundinaceum]|uniref:G coupled receptor like n=1 Tax=Trichoderma arundinaceum TaxID=490622 RepID=A0A395NGC5_TRIAR|nr:g coupled receptor like [Trichoderma arundinaceum]
MGFNATSIPTTDDGEELSQHQITTLVLLERIGGSISLASVMLIFLAYGLVRRVRNVQNTFIVFASVSNIGASIASIIAFDGMKAGQRSALCQAQSFMFEICEPKGRRAETTENGNYATVTTEVQVTHTLADPLPIKPRPAFIHRDTVRGSLEDSVPEIQPSSENQFYSSVTTSPPKEAPPQPPLHRRLISATRAFGGKFRISDPIKRAYLRTSFLFALSVLVTWIPSSLNRIHSWINKESPYDFHVATAAVLPLQGLWNAIIFFVTSWHGLKAWAQETLNGGAGAAERRLTDDHAMNERMTSPMGRCDSSIDDGDSATVGSDVELRRVPNSGTKTSNCL